MIDNNDLYKGLNKIADLIEAIEIFCCNIGRTRQIFLFPPSINFVLR